MKIVLNKEKIILNKQLTPLDEILIKFISVLDKCKIDYVIVSGYIAILFGRSRSSEDIDIIIKKIPYSHFIEFWQEMEKKFECIITEKPGDAYKLYLRKKTSLRFALKRKYIPNIELKFYKNDVEKWALKNRKKVILNNKTIFISPLELQIPFKLFLGSEKDIEDARYLYTLFKKDIDFKLLKLFNQKFKIGHLFTMFIK